MRSEEDESEGRGKRERENERNKRVRTELFLIFPECTYTKQFRTAGSRTKIGFNFYQLTEGSNPGWLGEKREHYLCAMPSPLVKTELKSMRERKK